MWREVVSARVGWEKLVAGKWRQLYLSSNKKDIKKIKN